MTTKQEREAGNEDAKRETERRAIEQLQKIVAALDEARMRLDRLAQILNVQDPVHPTEWTGHDFTKFARECRDIQNRVKNTVACGFQWQDAIPSGDQ